MATSSVIRTLLFTQKSLNFERVIVCLTQPVRDYWKPVYVPKPGVKGKSYRRIVHFEDKYTVKPLEITNLAGRDPVTGRVVCIGIGGGVRHKYHWINWERTGPTDLNEPPKLEKVLNVFPDGNRTSHVALIGSGKELYYILATMNMKPGDILKTHMGIPRIPVRANEGDCYPIGALAVGTQINCVSKYVGAGGSLCHGAGVFATIMRKHNDRVIIKLPDKREYDLDQRCMATVGRLSNEGHGETHIGSGWKLRELGYRPRSGLWHRKTGRHGRKIRPLPPVKRYIEYKPGLEPRIQLELNGL